MKKLESVLAAVDFGDASARALAVAGLIAGRCGARELRVLHAEPMDAPLYFTHEQIEALEKQRKATRRQAEKFLTTFAHRLTAQPLTAIIDDHPPVEAILRHSANVDLVLMGTHGRRGPSRWWLGSVAERVLRDVRQPLMIVRGAPNDGDGTLCERILAHAGSPQALGRAIEDARRLADCFGGRVIDAPATEIVTAVAQVDATLVVLAMPETRDAGWLASVGEPLIQACTRPLLFVPENRT